MVFPGRKISENHTGDKNLSVANLRKNNNDTSYNVWDITPSNNELELTNNRIANIHISNSVIRIRFVIRRGNNIQTQTVVLRR